MAEALSIVPLVLQIGGLLKQLYDYGAQVKGARKEISALSSELYALRGVLEDCKARNGPSCSGGDFLDILSTAQGALDDLQASLEPPHSKARRMQQSLWWPIKSDDVKKILFRLERAKTSLLLGLMGDFHEALLDFSDVKQDVKAISQTVSQEAARRIAYEKKEQRQKLLDEIAPVSPHITHEQICSISKDPSSGSWFLDGPFKAWMNESPVQTQILSLVAMSGAGKSTLVASTIEALKRAGSDTPLVAYMYCTHNDSATGETQNVLGAWVAQLSTAEPETLKSLMPQRNESREHQVLHLSNALVTIANSAGPVLLILDAINESKEPVYLCAAILGLVRRTKSIRVFVSSTSDLEIADTDGSYICRRIGITPSAILSDVKAYIKRQRLGNAVLRRVPEELFLEAIPPKTNGMFRWACCQMDLISQCSTPKKVKDALHHLPGSLDETYAALLQRVPFASREIVREALLWLSYSRRPMRLSELIDAVVLEEGDNVIDADCRIYPPSRLVEMCEGLITWHATTDIVSLAHSSVRNFLGSALLTPSDFKIETQSAEFSIIRKCLTYLLMTPFSIGHCTRGNRSKMNETYPLLEYAASMWPKYAQAYAESSSLNSAEMQLIERLFKSFDRGGQRNHFTFWVHCLYPESPPSLLRIAHPLYYAASFGLTQVIESLLSQEDIDFKDKESRWYINRKAGRAFATALQVACWRGHEGVVAALLKAGADPNSTNAYGMTNLGCAAEKGFLGIVRLLTEAGAKPDHFRGLKSSTRMQAEVPPLAGMPYVGRENLRPGCCELSRCLDSIVVDHAMLPSALRLTKVRDPECALKKVSEQNLIVDE